MHSSGAQQSSLLPTVGGRASVFAPLSREVNLAFTLSGARMINAHSDYKGGPWIADAMLSVDWYIWQ
jgi:hypothetical protein